MRLRFRQPLLRLALVLSLATAAGVAAPSPAQAGRPGSDSKVDGTLAIVANQAEANGGPQALVHVIAYGNAAGPLARLRASEVQELSLIGAYSGVIRVANLSALAHAPEVGRIVVNSPMVQTGGGTTVSSSSVVTLYPKVDNVQTAWNLGLTGSGASLAVLDSGVAPVADLGARLTQVAGSSSIGSANDTVGHGSFVATLAAGQSSDGRYLGIAPRANVYGVKVANGSSIYTSDVISGLTWVLNNRQSKNIKVVNLSLAEQAANGWLNLAASAADSDKYGLDYDTAWSWWQAAGWQALAGNTGAAGTDSLNASSSWSAASSWSASSSWSGTDAVWNSSDSWD